MMSLRVRSITYEAEGIVSFELVDPQGRDLPPVEAGAHLDVKVPGTSITRRYSLCNRPWEHDHYRIAVLDVPGGRGGSRAMHENVRAGQLLEVTGPHNFFPLAPAAPGRSLLLAGGIGVTPILAMAEQLAHDGRDWELHYCTQTPERTAFARRIATTLGADRVHVHHDGGQPGKGLDIAALLSRHEPGTHVYFCGPAGFMKAVSAATAHWPRDCVHFEYFGADPAAAPPAGADRVAGSDGGEVILQSSGRRIHVEPDQTILQALTQAGVEVASSCEAGVCGTCSVRYVSGQPVHNDYVLSDEERQSSVLVCCAMVGAEPLVLDL